MINQLAGALSLYLAKTTNIDRWDGDIPVCKIPNPTLAIQANSYYFGHPIWSKGYFEACHRDEAFASRWRAVISNWQNKIVVDIGCGPGNLYATLGDRCGKPQLLIGVDVSAGALKMAQTLGYTLSWRTPNSFHSFPDLQILLWLTPPYTTVTVW